MVLINDCIGFDVFYFVYLPIIRTEGIY